MSPPFQCYCLRLQIIIISSACGLAIGLALQGGLSNIAGGVIIMFAKEILTLITK